ncbi:MAG: substrate-binding domain-containing protein [Burkholderiales bacterium]|nr:substrate-binding domain-containing protein [Burkholderiales bacterium]
MIRRAWAALACVLALPCAADDLRLGATHTLEDSGVLPVLLEAFTKATGIKVRPLVAGTGQVMRYAENGDVDIVFTHSRRDEEQLIQRGIGLARADVMWNDFVIAGPSADPARVRGERDASAALRRIRAAGAKFISRGDDSGTHKKELDLWTAGGGLVSWPGYLSSGQGAGRTLMMAHELDAYDLVDRATLGQLSRRFPLTILVEHDPRLLNEYGVTTLKPTTARPVRAREADAFARWITSDAARSVIMAYRVEGERAFYLPGEARAGAR